MVHSPVVRQRLFSATLANGTKLYLAFLHDGSCAILKENEIIESWDNEIESLDLALDRFLEWVRRDVHVD